MTHKRTRTPARPPSTPRAVADAPPPSPRAPGVVPARDDAPASAGAPRATDSQEPRRAPPPPSDPAPPTERASTPPGRSFTLPRGLVVGGALALNLVLAYVVAHRDPSPPVAARPPASASSPARSTAAPPAASPRVSPEGAASAAVVPAGDIERARPGPWGDLEIVPAEVALRDDGVRAEECTAEVPPWTFADHGKERVLRLVKSLGLDPAMEETLLRTLHCAPGGGATGAPPSCRLDPSLAVVGALSPSARALVASALAAGRGLQAHRPVRRSRARAERWVEALPVAAPIRAQIRQLLVPLGEQVVFFDRALMCSRLAEPADKIALVRAVAEAPALLVRLRLPERADVAPLAAYWGAPGRREEVAALLASVANAPGGGAIDVAHLLPPFGRARALQYPRAGDPPWDGTASALAFAGKADAPPIDPAIARKLLESDFRLVPRDAGRLGDLVEIGAPGSGPAITHAVLVADDIVFAKLRPMRRAPWLFLRLADVVAEQIGDAPAEVSLLRRRDAP